VPLQGGPSVAVTRAYETGPNFVAIQEGRLVFKAGPGGSNTELYATRLTPKVRRR
jgi:hypothetical protein